MGKTNETRALSIRVPADLYTKVERRASRDDRTISQAVRQALKAYVEGKTP